MNALTSKITMALTVLIFIGGVVLGVMLLMRPASTQGQEDECETQTIGEGDDLTPNLVTANIYNAGNKRGLANNVSIKLQRQGFLAGEVGNASDDADASNVTILAEDPDHPAVKLLSKQFKGSVDVSEAPEDSSATELSSEGVAVVVGSDFKGVKDDAKRKVESDRRISVCVPLNLDDDEGEDDETEGDDE